jgi:hypothetical protein
MPRPYSTFFQSTGPAMQARTRSIIQRFKPHPSLRSVPAWLFSPVCEAVAVSQSGNTPDTRPDCIGRRWHCVSGVEQQCRPSKGGAHGYGEPSLPPRRRGRQALRQPGSHFWRSEHAGPGRARSMPAAAGFCLPKRAVQRGDNATSAQAVDFTCVRSSQAPCLYRAQCASGERCGAADATGCDEHARDCRLVPPPAFFRPGPAGRKRDCCRQRVRICSTHLVTRRYLSWKRASPVVHSRPG